MSRQPAPNQHPLLDLDVEHDGQRGCVVAVYPEIATAPERAMVELYDAPGRLPIVPTAALKIAREQRQ
jgi:hypothetical protein